MSSTQDTDQMDTKFNLLDLGRDAWDDTGIMQAFDENMTEYVTDHSKQMKSINVTTKVPSMTEKFGLNEHIDTVKKNYIEAKEIDDNNKNGNGKDTKNESSNDSDNSSNESSNESEDDSGNGNKGNNNNNNNNNRNNNNNNRNRNDESNRLEPSFVPFDEKYEWKTVDDENAMDPQNVVYSFENMGGNMIENENENENNGNKRKKSKKRKKNKNRQNKNMNQFDANEYYGQSQYQYDNSYSNVNQGQNQNPNANFDQNPQPPNVQIPDIFRQGLNLLPPTNEQSPNKSQALSNMLLAWYWTGYYAGHEAATSNQNRN